jgi:hypothetical protein
VTESVVLVDEGVDEVIMDRKLKLFFRLTRARSAALCVQPTQEIFDAYEF